MTQPDKVPNRTDTLLGRTVSSEVHPDVGYRITRLLGQGATARAYSAMRITPYGQLPVAIKIILPQIAQSESSVGNLVVQKEAVALGRLNERIPRCPYVVRFIDTGTMEMTFGGYPLRLPWLAVEFVDGGHEGTLLEDRVRYSVRHTAFAFDRARAGRALDAMARGLDEIHAVGVLHRDLKPTNVLCCGSGDTEIHKIADFGFARPMGLSATFGAIAVGTPGYTAPEQMLADRGNIGPQTDVFALAAITFFLLTGEDYFLSESAPDAYAEFRSHVRRSLADAKHLCPELKGNGSAIFALDQTLARATSFAAELRPRSAGQLAAMILPWLLDQPNSVHVSDRWLESMRSVRSSSVRVESNWIVRHPPDGERLILGAAWNADGHCLAATTEGLDYFDGSSWNRLPDPELLEGRRALQVKRHSPTTWLVIASGSRIVQVAREGTVLLADGRDEGLNFVDIDGDLDDLAVAIAEAPGRSPLICTRIGRHWIRSLELREVSLLSGVTRIDETRWLITGRDHGGRAWAGIHYPLDMRVSSLPVPDTRALVACASRRGQNLAVAVGTTGTMFFYDGNGTSTAVVPSCPDLSAVAIDISAQLWVASIGRIHNMLGPGSPCTCQWHNPSWNSPFISLHAEPGQLFALTVDGGVLESRIHPL